MINLEGWTIKNICCGSVFIGPFHQVLVDPRFLKSHTGECICKGMWGKVGENCLVQTDEEIAFSEKSGNPFEPQSQFEQRVPSVETNISDSQKNSCSSEITIIENGFFTPTTNNNIRNDEKHSIVNIPHKQETQDASKDLECQEKLDLL
ncbi:hypothetical protein HZS_5112 [Henneguya salminicola]|nr:hypothetical protein HZS_5112 [Henneguya salminicola]